MRYVLNPRYLLRGWYKSPTGLFDTWRNESRFFTKEDYVLLMKCDGTHEIDEAVLSEDQQKFFDWLKKAEIIREAGIFDYLVEEQEYRAFPARYKKHAH